ncbi:hypothetical protein, partial [Methylomonas lenta]|uniref:hypothetical protein n=1 Tax=Methylomonas lenta TaxID=980561 RepID=UPI000A01D567
YFDAGGTFQHVLRVPSVPQQKSHTDHTESLSACERQKLLAYLAEIEETDPIVIDEVLTVCSKDPEKRQWLLQWADRILPAKPIDTLDNRHFCRGCSHLGGELCTRHQFRSVDDLPRRCADFLPKVAW